MRQTTVPYRLLDSLTQLSDRPDYLQCKCRYPVHPGGHLYLCHHLRNHFLFAQLDGRYH
ncbi:hypothetical protein V5G28_012355 [Scytonema sp. PRP1]